MSSLSDLAKTFLDKDPKIANRQLWDQLPGRYELCRQGHLKETSVGDSEIIPRTTMDAAYEEELLQTSTFSVVAEETEKTEKRVFRLKNGDWSFWAADRNGTVTKKLADLKLGPEVAPPSVGNQMATLEASTRGEVFMKLDFCIGPKAWWSMRHQAKNEGGETMEQFDFYIPGRG